MNNPTQHDLLNILRYHPHPEQTNLWIGKETGRVVFTIPHACITYDGNVWAWSFCDGFNAPTLEQTEPVHLPSLAPDSVHAEIDRILSIIKQTHMETDTVTTNPAPEDTKEQKTMTESETNELKNTLVAQLFNILADHPYPGATNLSGGCGGFVCFDIDGLCVAYDRGMWGVHVQPTEYQITPNFPQSGPLTVRDVHAEISRVVKIGKSHHANTRAVVADPKDPQPKRSWVRIPDGMTEGDVLNTDTNEQTPSWEQIKADCVGPDLPTEQTFVSTDRYRELEVELKTVRAEFAKREGELIDQRQGWYSQAQDAENKLKTVTEERDAAQKKNDLINCQLSDLRAERERLFEKIDHLKSKSGLLSVVCRRLCGDENASIETVHKALNRVDDESRALDYIGEKVGSVPFNLREVQSLVAQAVKSLSEKTVENAKLQEGVKNYEAQLKGYAANKRLQTLDRITKILQNAGIATVYDSESEQSIETDERIRILCERLKQNTVKHRDDAATIHKLVEEIRQIHLTLDEMSAPRCMGTIDLSPSARIRSLFNTKV